MDIKKVHRKRMIGMQRQFIEPAVHLFSGDLNLFQLIRIVRGGKIRKALWARQQPVFFLLSFCFL